MEPSAVVFVLMIGSANTGEGAPRHRPPRAKWRATHVPSMRYILHKLLLVVPLAFRKTSGAYPLRRRNASRSSPLPTGEVNAVAHRDLNRDHRLFCGRLVPHPNHCLGNDCAGLLLALAFTEEVEKQEQKQQRVED